VSRHSKDPARLDSAQLDADLTAYLAFLQVEVAMHPFLDLAQAHDLAARLSRLLACWPDLLPAQRQSLSDVIAYFVDPADEEHDTLSPIGLVDDEERVATLEAELDRRVNYESCGVVSATGRKRDGLPE
jgi:hypothetical protein